MPRKRSFTIAAWPDEGIEYVVPQAVAKVVARVEELCALVPPPEEEEEEEPKPGTPLDEEHVPDTLRVSNPVGGDSAVLFRDKGHRYDVETTRPDGTIVFVHNKGVIMSVSSLTKYVLAPFRRDAIAVSSSTSHRIQLEKALVAASAMQTPSVSQLTEVLGEAAAKKLAGNNDFFKLISQPGATNFNTRKGQHVLGALRATYGPEIYAKFGYLDHVEAKQEWRSANMLGTYVHRQIYRWYNGAPADMENHEFRNIFLPLTQQYPEIARENIFRSEFSMQYKPLLMTGQADAVFYSRKKPGYYDLGDWKVTNKVHNPADTTPEFKAAFPNYRATKLTGYYIQLNIYRFMLQQMGFKIDEVFIMVLHKDHSGFRKFLVPETPRELHWVLNRRAEELVAMGEKVLKW